MRKGPMHAGGARDLDALFGGGLLADLPDGELLDRFIARRDEAAVAALVARHGGMVLGVCRRVLADPHDADDAFQATFLVLARRAATVRPSDQVARWLHGVALRTARKARSLRNRRRGREVVGAAPIAEVAAPPEAADPDRAERLDRLDRAIAGLPGRYRVPVVLCLLEGRTHREAADLLGWPVGTVSGRLSRARALLARRVRAWEGSDAGPGPGPLALPILVGPPLPPGRVAATARALTLWGLGRPALTTPAMAPILLLTREVIRTMTLSKIKLFAALALGVSLAVGTGAGLLTASVVDTPATVTDDAPTPDLAPLQGLWTGTIGEIGGRAQPLPGGPDIQILVRGDRVSLRGIDFGGTSRVGPEVVRSFRATLMYPFLTDNDKPGRSVGRLDFDPDHARLIDLTAAPEPDDIAPTVHLGVYWVDGDNFRLVLSRPNKHRPTPLKTEAGTAQVLFILRRTPHRVWGDISVPEGNPSGEPALEVRPSTRSKTAAPADLLAERGRSDGASKDGLDRQRSIRQAARAIAEAPEVTPDLIEPMRHLLDLQAVRLKGADAEPLRADDARLPAAPGSGVAPAPGAPLPSGEPGRTALTRLDARFRPAEDQPAPGAEAAGEILKRGIRDRAQSKRVVQVPSDLKVDADLRSALARAGSWRVLRAEDVTKDAMVLKYLPDWDRGDVDNLGIGNAHGGNWTLVDWQPIAPDEATRPSRRFILAFYARTTNSGTRDPGPILAEEILEDWPERVSWRTRPAVGPEVETTADFRFEPGEGWKLLDVTKLMRARGREDRAGRGVALSFLLDNPNGDGSFSDYRMVSREAQGEWESKRPRLLVVEPLDQVR